MDERLAFTQPRSDWRVSRGGIAFSERGIGCWNPASGDSTGLLAVDDGHEAEGRSAQPHGFFQHPVKYRSKVAGRRIDDLQDFGHRSLLRLGLVTLPGAVVQFPLQLSVGSPKTDYFIIERRGHLHLPVRPAAYRIIPDWYSPLLAKAVRLDHLMVEGVKSARECLIESFSPNARIEAQVSSRITLVPN